MNPDDILKLFGGVPPTPDQNPLAALGINALPSTPVTGPQYGPPTPAVTPQSLYSQALAIPDAPAKAPAFRTPDLIALLGTALAGHHAGQFLGSYLQQKQGIAQDDTQRAQAAVDRSRQDLISQSNFLEQENRTKEQQAQFQAKLAADAAEGAASRKNTLDIAQGRYQNNIDVQNAKGKFAVASQVAKAQAAKDIADSRSDDKRFGQLIGLATKGTPEERAYALGALRDNYKDEFGGLSDAQVTAGANLTQKELESKANAAAKQAQADLFHKQAGYYGARTQNLDALTPVQKALYQARARKANNDADTEVSKAGLLEEQSALIAKKVQYYEPEFRARVARYTAQSQKAATDPNPKAIAQQRTAYNGMYKLATDQLARIKAENKGVPTLADPMAYAAYIQATADQAEASDNLKRLNQTAVSLNPVTQGRSLAPVSNQGAVSGPTGDIGVPIVPGASARGGTSDVTDLSRYGGSGGRLFGQTFRPNESDLYQQAQDALQKYKGNPKALKAIQDEVVRQLQARRRR